MGELTLEITNNCPLYCVHCSTRASRQGDVYWSLEDVEHYTKKYDHHQDIRLSGGEPFQHPQLEDIVKYLHNQGKSVTILSSGVTNFGENELGARPLTKKTLRRVKPFIKEIVFSLQGHYDSHDRIVISDHNPYRHPPYCDILLDSTEPVQELNIPFSFHTVLMKSNIDSIPDILRDVALFGYHHGRCVRLMHLHLLRFVKQGRGKKNDKEALEPKDFQRVQKMIDDFQETIDSGQHFLFQPGKYIYVTQTNSIHSSGCDCGTAKSVVTYDKEEIPCSAMKRFKGVPKPFMCRHRL